MHLAWIWGRPPCVIETNRVEAEVCCILQQGAELSRHSEGARQEHEQLFHVRSPSGLRNGPASPSAVRSEISRQGMPICAECSEMTLARRPQGVLVHDIADHAEALLDRFVHELIVNCCGTMRLHAFVEEEGRLKIVP